MYTWYFAYGSNMDEDRIRGRGVRVIKWMRGRLKDYRLVFNKPCRFGGCANIEPSKGSIVEGVLYLIPEEDLYKLDWFEGYPTHYDRRVFTIETDEGSIEAWAYIAVKTRDGLKPSREYMNFLIRGAEKHGLSREYISKLKNYTKL